MVEFMEQHIEQESECCKKMQSANKFIDFFVHDILDFSVLNQNEKNFTKIKTVFSVRTADNEILDMLVDKIKLKNIQVN